jgi:ATP-dependent DNA helicase HFM1/MER3
MKGPRAFSSSEPSTPTPMPVLKRASFTPINQRLHPATSNSNSTNRGGLSPSHSREPRRNNLQSAFIVANDIDQGIVLPTSTLPDRLRSVFPFDYFNAMQSRAFQPIYGSDTNIVLSAPTGSGKTVCFEFAIARLMSNDPSSTGPFKVFLLPTSLALKSTGNLYWTHQDSLSRASKRLESEIFGVEYAL